MPHITKFQEKRQCIKTSYDDRFIGRKRIHSNPAIKKMAQQCIRALAIPPEYSRQINELSTQYCNYRYEEKKSLFDLIEQIVDDTLPKMKDLEFFNEFINIKEDTYGRYNSDSDYWGS
jgi:hypothetical protein